MAPKKGKRKELAHRIVRFVNDEAKERFEILKSKPMIYERGFQIEKRAWSVDYVDQIEKQGWSTFCHPRTEANLQWVQEFYANARFHSDEKVAIRGKLVDFSKQAIETSFDLPHREDGHYERFKASIPPHEVADALCNVNENKWANEAKFVLSSASFTRQAKVWLLFVNSSIIPTKHSNQVSLDRAFLIYCILKGAPVDVGGIISGLLKKKVKTEGGQQLWFPTLITELCRHAGVVTTSTDTQFPVGHPISEKVISSYIKVRTRGPSTSKAADPMASSSKTTKASKKGGSSDAQFATIMEHLNYMATAQRYHHRHMDAFMDIMRDEQVRLLEHAKLKVTNRKFPFSSPFDRKGYLTTADDKRMPPFEDAEDSPDVDDVEEEELSATEEDDDGSENDSASDDDDGGDGK